MAAPATHIVLTDKIYDKYFPGFGIDRKKFYIGTLFPDIYKIVEKTERPQTHLKKFSLKDHFSMAEIQGENSFRAGIKFHSLLDEIRENFIITQDAYSIFPDSDYSYTFPIKFAEDCLLYQKRKDWNEILSFLKSIIGEERQTGISQEGLEKWHNLLKKYLSETPSVENVVLFLEKYNIARKYIASIQKDLELVLKSDFSMSIIEKLYNGFEKLLEKELVRQAKKDIVFE